MFKFLDRISTIYDVFNLFGDDEEDHSPPVDAEPPTFDELMQSSQDAVSAIISFIFGAIGFIAGLFCAYFLIRAIFFRSEFGKMFRCFW